MQSALTMGRKLAQLLFPCHRFCFVPRRECQRPRTKWPKMKKAASVLGVGWRFSTAFTCSRWTRSGMPSAWSAVSVAFDWTMSLLASLRTIPYFAERTTTSELTFVTWARFCNRSSVSWVRNSDNNRTRRSPLCCRCFKPLIKAGSFRLCRTLGRL